MGTLNKVIQEYATCESVLGEQIGELEQARELPNSGLIAASYKRSYLLYETGNSLPSDCISLNHIASEKEFCLQAADAVAGAYFQKYEKHNDEYVKIIEHKVGFFKYLWK